MRKWDNDSIIAKQLMDGGKLDETVQSINNIEKVERKSLRDKVLYHLLKCDLLYQQGSFENVVKLAEQTYKESLGLDKDLLSVDALLLKAQSLIKCNCMENGYDIIMQIETLLEDLAQEFPIGCKHRKASVSDYTMSWVI